MRFRVGILDVGAAIIVLIAVFLPAREPKVHPAHPHIAPALAGEISRLQARLLVDPADCESAELLADELSRAGFSDYALRVAGQAASHAGDDDAWRCYRSLSITHGDRVEIAEAHEYATRAVAACRTADSCVNHQMIRLEVYTAQLDSGLKSGIDPLSDPSAFREAVGRAGIQVRVKPNPQ